VGITQLWSSPKAAKIYFMPKTQKPDVSFTKGRPVVSFLGVLTMVMCTSSLELSTSGSCSEWT